MQPEPRFKRNSILAGLIILVGIILLIYMVLVESEPGALPLFLIVAGTVWLLLTRYQERKDRRNP